MGAGEGTGKDVRGDAAALPDSYKCQPDQPYMGFCAAGQCLLVFTEDSDSQINLL